MEKSEFFLKKAAVAYVAKNRTLAFVSSASWVAKIIVVKSSLCGFIGTEVPTFCYRVIIFSTHFVPGTLPEELIVSKWPFLSRNPVVVLPLVFQERDGFFSDHCNC